MKAVWNGVVLAESNQGVVVEGNYYFPPNSINKEYFKKSSTHTTCFWKGEASYYTIEVDGESRQDGAWYYPSTTRQAKHIEGYVAFTRNVQVEK